MTISRARFEHARDTLSIPDYGLMRRVNRWRAPRWFRWWMLLATKAGDGWLWGAIGIALLMSSDPQRFRAIEAGFCAVAAGIGIFHKIKRVVGRTRPRDIEPHCWACIVTRDRFSFPSGHSTTSFAVAVALGSFYPEARPLLLVLAANVAVSRVVVGMHFLSDVLVGSGMGALLGYAAYLGFARSGLA
jgi:undecaprenyl-diphosphatase